MYRYDLSPSAGEKLAKLARRNPRLARTIGRKICWLAEHADEIAHQSIKGSEFFSLHVASMRIPYLLDKTRRHILIDDIDYHDPAYDRINR